MAHTELRLKIGSRRTPYVLANGAAIDYVKSGLFRSIVIKGERLALRVTLHKQGGQTSSYHIYEGGLHLKFSIPRQQVHPGETVEASIENLPLGVFVRNLRSFQLYNRYKLKWLAESAFFEAFKLKQHSLTVLVEQNCPLVGLKKFALTGDVLTYPGISNQYGGVYVEFGVEDYLGRQARFRLRDNGFTSPSLQFPAGRSYKTVQLLSYDGLRLKVVYGSERNVATLYIHPPSDAIYRLSDMLSYEGPHLNLITGRFRRAFVVETFLVRRLEKWMLKHGRTYDGGRLGAEISYLIGRTRLGLDELVLEEPSVGEGISSP